MTFGEAHVAEENWPKLQDAYARRTQQLEPEMLHTYLLQSMNDPSLWRILTVWSSLDALRALRQRQPTHIGELIFREAGAEPAGGGVFNVVTSAPGD